MLSVLRFPVGALVGDASARGGSLSVHLGPGGFAAYAGICLLYYIVLEIIWGATIGKLIVGVRVRAGDGRRAAPWQVVVRNLLRPVDVLPLLYLVGYLVMMATGPEHRQRIGDRLARTVVVPREASPPPPPA